MYRQHKIGEWLVQIDELATETANALVPDQWPDNCTCLYCRNFVTVCERGLLPEGFRELCANLMIDPRKTSEVILHGESKVKGCYLYEGWYHLVGEIEDGPDLTVKPGHYTEISEDLSVLVMAAEDLLPDGFPKPVVEVRFFTIVPWLLEELPFQTAEQS